MVLEVLILRYSRVSCVMYMLCYFQVMDNFLIQVRGRKRVVLFHPSSVNFLYMNGM